MRGIYKYIFSLICSGIAKAINHCKKKAYLTAFLNKYSSIVLFSFIFFLYAPTVLFVGNSDEMLISYSELFPLIFVFTIVAVGILICFFNILRKQSIREIYMNIIWALGIGVYIQITFLNSAIPQLNGSSVEWNSYSTMSIISSCVFGACVISSIILHAIKRAKKIRIISSMIISGMCLIAMIILLLTNLSSKKDNDFAVTKDSEFILSSDDNIIVFVVDTLDAQFAEENILTDNENADIFKDFTYYSNVVAGGAPTHLGMPALLTGRIFYPEEMSLEDYYAKAYGESTLFKDLKESGYTVKLYTESNFLKHADIDNIANITKRISNDGR